MVRKGQIVIVFLCSILMCSVCWAGPDFQDTASRLKVNADAAKKHAREIEQLSDRIRVLAVNIENLSDTIRNRSQKGKIERLENKIDLFHQKVVELERLTDILRNLTTKMQAESNRMSGTSDSGPKRRPRR